MKHDKHETHTFDWRGITIEMTHDPLWAPEQGYCRLTLTTVAPYHCCLPVTDTGYAAHITHAALIEQADGPIAYMTGRLDAAATSAKWRKQEVAQRQLSLF